MHEDLGFVTRLNITFPPPAQGPDAVAAFKSEVEERLQTLFNIPPERLHYKSEPSAVVDVSAYISKSRTNNIAKVLCAMAVFRLHLKHFGTLDTK